MNALLEQSMSSYCSSAVSKFLTNFSARMKILLVKTTFPIYYNQVRFDYKNQPKRSY
jgi:hypothetical protein